MLSASSTISTHPGALRAETRLRPPRDTPTQPGPEPAATAGAEAHLDRLNRLTTSPDSCVFGEKGLTVAELHAQVGRMVRASGDLSAIATALRLGLGLPGLTLPDTKLDALFYELSEPSRRRRFPLDELLAVLQAAGDRPHTFGLPLAERRAWRDAFWQAMADRAARQSDLVPWMRPLLEEQVGMSALLLQLEGQPHALAALLCGSFGGPECAHSAEHKALCLALRAAVPHATFTRRCVDDALIAALLRCCDPAHADTARLKEYLDEIRRRFDAGRIGVTPYRDALQKQFAALAENTLPAALSRQRAEQRRDQAAWRQAPAAQYLPPALAHLAHLLDRVAVDATRGLHSTCLQNAKSHHSLRHEIARDVGLLFERFQIDPLPPGGGGAPAQLLDQRLDLLRAAVLGLRRSVGAAAAVAGLEPAQRDTALEGAEEALNRRLSSVPWQPTDIVGKEAGATLQALVTHWLKLFRRWRESPPDRDDQLAAPDSLVPHACIGTDATDDIAPVRHEELLRAFERCLSTQAIEDPMRQALTEIVQGQLIDVHAARSAPPAMPLPASGSEAGGAGPSPGSDGGEGVGVGGDPAAAQRIATA